ncbi:uncharacterized protein TRIADDRAFT_59258 [Trichoplax adhaerens]|uniref:Uncharacterized protein n=1 Tax=Trichoplax adhaerens TaxID=10228 RepID=B3S5A7_TRIAD|nr:predicted protein [Trichoplax adhaerens]EDV22103.1 predicted protein [Trichoplax adhaerens]|eukprot:XP_002115258.1 predicted protein [Trichoplax adhaerens]
MTLTLPCCTIGQQPLAKPKIVIDEEGKRVICIAKIDANIIQRAMIRHSCYWSLIPIYGCFGLQPLRAICWASNESRLQAEAIHLILYESYLQLDVDSYPMFCTCSGSGPPPDPYNEFTFCSILPATSTAIDLSDIKDIKIESFMGCQRLHIVGHVNEERVSIIVLGIENLNEFTQLLEIYTVKCKDRNNSMTNGNNNSQNNHRITKSYTVESCLNGYHSSSRGSLAVNTSITVGLENPLRVVKENEFKEKPSTSEISPIAL